MDLIKVNFEWIPIIRDLFDFMIRPKEENIRKYDNYIYSSFKCFVKHKRKLKFILKDLSHCNICFVNLIIHQLAATNKEEDIEVLKGMVSYMGDINLPKKQVLTMFENVEQLELDLSHSVCDIGKVYVISLSSLLSNIKSHCSLKRVTITLGSWKFTEVVRSLYSLSEEMKRKYKSAGYIIHLEEVSHSIDCVIDRES